MDSPIIAIGKVEATRQDNSYGAISGHIVLLALFSVRFLAKSKRGGLSLALWLDEKVLKGSPAQNPLLPSHSVLLRPWSFQHIRTSRLVRACPFSSPYRRARCGTYPQGEHPHQSCLGGQEEGRGG